MMSPRQIVTGRKLVLPPYPPDAVMYAVKGDSSNSTETSDNTETSDDTETSDESSKHLPEDEDENEPEEEEDTTVESVDDEDQQ